jgi:hypothetical protein
MDGRAAHSVRAELNPRRSAEHQLGANRDFFKEIFQPLPAKFSQKPSFA